MSLLLEWVRAYPHALTLEIKEGLAEAILSEVMPQLRPLIFRKLDPKAAEDVGIIIMQAILEHLERFRGNTNAEFCAWCRSIARHKIVNCVRKEHRELLNFVDLDALPEALLASETQVPLSRAERLDLEYALELLRAARPPCVEYLWLYYIEDWDYQEIAERYGFTYDRTRMKIYRCLELAYELVTKPNVNNV